MSKSNMSKKYHDMDKWKEAVKQAYPQYAAKMRFHGRIERGVGTVSAEVPGIDRCFGVWNQSGESGEVLGESKVRESMTFKAFLSEAEINAKAAGIAKNLLGVLDVEQVADVPEEDIMAARELSHKFIDTAIGPWVISAFKHAGKMFARVQPPKGAASKTTYFVPRGQ